MSQPSKYEALAIALVMTFFIGTLLCCLYKWLERCEQADQEHSSINAPRVLYNPEDGVMLEDALREIPSAEDSGTSQRRSTTNTVEEHLNDKAEITDDSSKKRIAGQDQYAR